MLRSHIKTCLALMLVITAAAVFSPRAMAQNNDPKCCFYYVDIQGFDSSCFDIKLTTAWVPGPAITSASIPGNGFWSYPIGPPDFPPCPSAPLFRWASLDGGVTVAWFNNPATFKVNGCCFLMRVSFDINGCLVITIRPCP